MDIEMEAIDVSETASQAPSQVYQPRSNTYFRGEDMMFCQLYLQPEAMFEFVKRIGELGIFQFKDVRKEVILVLLGKYQMENITLCMVFTPVKSASFAPVTELWLIIEMKWSRISELAINHKIDRLYPPTPVFGASLIN